MTTMRHVALDGLRGVAVLLVIAYHLGSASGRPLLPAGFLGVDLFFVLSGFLITSLLVREQARFGTIDLWRFYGRRAVRLFPALILFLLIWGRYMHPQTLAFIAGYIFNWLEAARGADVAASHLWSLSVEEQYYLVWALALSVGLARGWKKDHLLTGSLVLVLALAGWREVLWYHGATMNRIYFGTDTHLDGILLGSALGLADMRRVAGWLREHAQTYRWLSLMALMGIVVVLVTGAGTSAAGLGMMPAASLPIAIAWTLVLTRVCIAPWPLLVAGLSRRPLAWIGRISYGVYLWHGVFALLTQVNPLWQSISITLAGSLLVASLSFYGLEQPVQRAFHARLVRTIVAGARPAYIAATANGMPTAAGRGIV